MMQSALYNELQQKLEASIEILPDKPEESAESILKALWHLAAGEPMSVHKAMTLDLPVLADDAVEQLKLFVNKRIEGIPLAHLTQRQQFMGVEMVVGAQALVPRKETELLGYAALDKLNAVVNEQGQAKVIDVCTGSGNVALGLAAHQEKAQVYAADLSEEAVELATQNSQLMELDKRVHFAAGDLFAPFDQPEFYQAMDLVTCNPPYISSGKMDTMPGEIIEHEPSLAFDGGPFGINILSKLIKEAPKYLKSGSWLCFEVGLGQGEPLLKRLSKNEHYTELDSIADDNGDVRVILAKSA